eukprot:575787-Rhodomonas_salina.1
MYGACLDYAATTTGPPRRFPALIFAVLLRSCYEMSGTDLRYAATTGPPQRWTPGRRKCIRTYLTGRASDRGRQRALEPARHVRLKIGNVGGEAAEPEEKNLKRNFGKKVLGFAGLEFRGEGEKREGSALRDLMGLAVSRTEWF